LLVARSAAAADASTPGAVTAPYPTLENIALEWALTGDDNADATATVRYRKLGASTYRDGLPLFRVPAGSNEGFDWTNKLSGSIFGLEPGTEYELELTLTDPDGGNATESLTATTRPLPTLPGTLHTVAVDPTSIGDALDSAVPGDLLLLADGTYDELVVTVDGSQALPLVLQAENPGQAVVEGDVRLDGRSHVWVQDLTIHGKIKANDATALVVRACAIETPDDGIVAYGDGLTNSVIIDNVIHGSTLWRESALGVDGDNIGEGVQFTGPGNVVAYNRVSGFRDCLSLLEDDEAVNQVSDDFYGNDLSECADDAIEADFAMGNVRVYGNRIQNSFMGLSSQPGLGGPTYFVRNALYNVLFQAFKLQRSSVGDVGFHNTVVKSGDAFAVNTDDVFSRATFRNNLLIGGPGDTYLDYDQGPGDILMLPSADATCSFDYDGFGSIGTGTFAGRVGDIRFDGLDELHSQTTEAHAVEVDLTVFDASVPLPADPFSAPAAPSLLLASDSAALDRGIPLANINDAFSGSAPDIGAFELGSPEPTYGPGGDISGTGGSSGTDTGGASGDASGGTNGSGADAGTPNSGGTNSNGGQSSAGRVSTGGSTTGGASGTTGGSTTGGTATGAAGSGATSGSSSTGKGGTTSNGGAPSAGASDSADEDSGCGCRVPRGPSNAASAWALALSIAAARVRRRRPATR
jgi:hypothetical protein